MTDTTKAGSARELGEAATRMVQAVVQGDADEIERAMSDYAAALGSQATSSMAAIAAPLMTAIIDLRAAIDRSDRARLERNTQFQLDMDARLDIHGATLDRIEEGLIARRQAIDERLDVHERRLDGHDVEIAQIKRHLGLDGDG